MAEEPGINRVTYPPFIPPSLVGKGGQVSVNTYAQGARPPVHTYFPRMTAGVIASIGKGGKILENRLSQAQPPLQIYFLMRTAGLIASIGKGGRRAINSYKQVALPLQPNDLAKGNWRSIWRKNKGK